MHVGLDDLIKVAADTQREAVRTIAETLIKALDEGGEACCRAMLKELIDLYSEQKP